MDDYYKATSYVYMSMIYALNSNVNDLRVGTPVVVTEIETIKN